MRFIKYPSIEKFSAVVKNVRNSAKFVRYDEEANEPIFDESLKAPTINVVLSFA